MLQRPLRFVTLAALLAMALSAPIWAADNVVDVFILAGQSNMEGKAPNKLFDIQAEAPDTKAFFGHLRKDGKWISPKDVYIRFLDRHGPLTLGYGSPGRTGMEYEFGYVMGEHLKHPILLIKTAWGGHSLYEKFRPPSAGDPPHEIMDKLLKNAQGRVERDNKKHNRNDPLPTAADVRKDFGVSYRNMMDQIHDTLDHMGAMFPELAGKKPHFAGFVWFQGWNDMYNGAEKEYASNMKYFIKDVRKDLDSPKLPFVIDVMGQNGSQPAKGAMAVVQQAQLAMADVPEFKGNVAAVRTDVLVDKTAEKLYPDWRKHFDEWQKVGGDFGYHYMGSAIWFTRIGHESAEAMLKMMGDAQ